LNTGGLQDGGRLYGAWWINMPKRLRKDILIDGESTTELDYSGCAIRLLYHDKKIDFQGDPYYLEPIAKCEQLNGLEPGHFRESVKALVQAQINGDRDGHSELVPTPVSFRPFFKRREVVEMITQKHAEIADTFHTAAWGRLQRQESDLALEILTRLTNNNVVALSIHDSFVSKHSDKNQLMRTMEDQYERLFGFPPIIRVV
jgi:hypothetical protein